MSLLSIVLIKNFSKSYGDHLVIDDISLSINQGEIYGILGVNGAGKTTLLECVEGIRSYQEGEVSICGLSQSEALKKTKFGVQMQSASLPDVIKVNEVVRLFCSWNDSMRYDELMSLFQLEELSQKTYQSLSTGQKRKLHLVLSIVSDPEIIFLDEPTAGLDVEARAELHKMLKSLKQEGKTIILSSHDMAEVESLCDQIVFLKDGKIYFEGAVQKFRNLKIHGYKVQIRITGDSEVKMYEIESINRELPKLLQSLIDQNLEIEDLLIHKPTLEDRFLDVARGESK